MRPFKLSILSNYAEHLKGLAPFVIHVAIFYNSKISIPNESASSFRQMTSIRWQGRFARRGQVSETLINRSNNGNHKNSQGSNKPEPSEALTWPKAPIGLSKAPFPTFWTLDVARYTKKDMDYLFQTFFQASKDGFGDKFKAQTLDVYRGRSHMECYKFC